MKGDAARIISGLPLTNLNYKNSETLFKDCYGQPQQIISTHIQTLINLPKPLNKLASLRVFHDAVESHIRCLESLGKSPELLDPLLVQTMLKKSYQKRPIKELQTVLRNEIRIFEAG